MRKISTDSNFAYSVGFDVYPVKICLFQSKKQPQGIVPEAQSLIPYIIKKAMETRFIYIPQIPSPGPRIDMKIIFVYL